MEKTEGLRLHRAAQEKRHLLELLGQFGDERFAHFVARHPIEHEPKSAFSIMLTHQDDAAMKERPVKPSLIEKQLPL